jgi:hypothetical protein
MEIMHAGILPCPNCYMRSYIDGIDLTYDNKTLKQVHKTLRAVIITTGDVLLGSRVIGLRMSRLANFFFSHVRW